MDIKSYFETKAGLTRTEFVRAINEDTIKNLPEMPWLRSLTLSSLVIWILKNKPPAERAIQTERVTGGVLTRHMLRPDLYPTKKD